MYPFQAVAYSAPAQWMRPTGGRNASPYAVHTPGAKCAP